VANGKSCWGRSPARAPADPDPRLATFLRERLLSADLSMKVISEKLGHADSGSPGDLHAHLSVVSEAGSEPTRPVSGTRPR